MAPGDTVTYKVNVTNTSTTTGHGTVTDPTPAGLLPGSWTATATPGSTVTPTSGTGAITGAQVTVAPGGKVTFTVTAQIDPTFDETFDIDNVATLVPGPNTNCDPTDPTQACDANWVTHVITPASPVLVSTPATATPQLVPAPATATPELAATGATLWPLLQAALALLVCGGILLCATRRRPHRRSTS